MSDRLEWRSGKYSTETGYSGNVSLFGITWKTQRGAPDWSMRTELPGLRSKTWESNDKDELRATAERVLDQWLARRNGEG